MPAASDRQSGLRRFGTIAEQAVALALPVLVAMASVFLVEHVVFLKAADWFIKDTEIATLTAPAPQDPDIVIAKLDEDTLRLFRAFHLVPPSMERFGTPDRWSGKEAP